MQTENQSKAYSRPLVGLLVLVTGSLLLVGSIALAISVGAANLDLAAVWRAVLHYDATREADQIVMSLRLPRELGAAIVGAAFAVSGAIMQGLTRNPLAEPGLLGLNAGASFALACIYAFLPSVSYLSILFLSFLGAGLGAGIVLGLGTLKEGGMTPLRITLAGAAVSTLFTALAEGIAIYYKVSQDLSFWIAGGVSGVNWNQLKIIFPIILLGIVLSFLLSRELTVLSFGEEVAKGLGQRTFLVKIILMVIVFILAGAAVSIVGAVAFVGLIIPHIVRFLVGTDYRWVLPCSAIFGSLFMVLADAIAKTVNAPFETPIGAVVAIAGIPFFFYLVRRGERRF